MRLPIHTLSPDGLRLTLRPAPAIRRLTGWRPMLVSRGTRVAPAGGPARILARRPLLTRVLRLAPALPIPAPQLRTLRTREVVRTILTPPPAPAVPSQPGAAAAEPRQPMLRLVAAPAVPAPSPPEAKEAATAPPAPRSDVRLHTERLHTERLRIERHHRVERVLARSVPPRLVTHAPAPPHRELPSPPTAVLSAGRAEADPAMLASAPALPPRSLAAALPERRRGPAATPAPTIDDLADQVLRRIERRAFAQRERLGAM